MPVVPTPPTILDGITPSSTWNQFRDAIRFLQAKPVAQMRQTSAQTLTTAVFTPIEFQVETFDLDIDGVGGHDNSVNPSRFTSRYQGYYLASGLVTFLANAAGARHAGWRVNGIDVPGSYLSVTPTAADVNGVAPKAMRVFLDIGDYVELIGFQSSGGNLATYIATSAYQSGMDIGWDRTQ